MGSTEGSGNTALGGSGCISRLFGCLPASYALRAVLFLALTLPLTYYVENWRGRHAWQVYKAAAELKGEVLDWHKLVPPPVPDELNAFKAPLMEQWFVNANQQWLSLLMSEEVVFGVPRGGPLVEITVEPQSAASGQGYDIRLDHFPPLVLPGAEEGGVPGPAIVPLIVMDEVPLPDAIRNLARQAGLNYMLDPQLFARGFPMVSLRWENVTALQALAVLLYNYDLGWIEDAHSKILRISYRPQDSFRGQLVPQAVEPLRKAVQERVLRAEPDPSIPRLPAATGSFVLFRDTPQPALNQSVSPVKVLFRSDTEISAAELRRIIRNSGVFSQPYRIRVVAAGTNQFRLYSIPPQFCGASDYLARTARFEKEFCLIREALQRPMTRVDGNYDSQVTMPLPNYGGLRVMAQTLAQRAQAHLLVDNPAAALEEIRLIHGLCAFLENRPSGKPVSLVSTMIRVSLARLCGKIVAEGFQLGAWQEPQLRQLQPMLAGFRLTPAVHGALGLERAGLYQTLESMSADQSVQVFSGRTLSPWDKLKCPAYWLLSVAPRGWVYQNMVTAATLGEPASSAYEPVTDRLDPRRLKTDSHTAIHRFGKFSPYAMLALKAVPVLVNAWKATAETQALIDHAYLACGLALYKADKGTYPQQLQSLLPTFASTLPRDILTGEVPRYRAISGDFELYSVGWNQIDDGGYLPRESDPPGERLDWVWPGHRVAAPYLTAVR